MNFNKTIDSIDEISNIADKVLERMNEPDLKGKSIELRILDGAQFESYMANMGTPEQLYRNSNGCTYCKGEDSFTITLRKQKFASTFSSYFHELGHAATENLVSKLKLPSDKKETYAEALAYSFELYAKEEFNKLKFEVKFMDVLTPFLRREYLKEIINFPGRTREHAVALSMIYGLLDTKYSTYKQVYKNLKKAIEK